MKILRYSGIAESTGDFDNLSTNRNALWLSAAKKCETRDKRLSQTLSRLLGGKKNPSKK